MTKLMKKSKRGFTLVELVIVIAILAIVAAIAIPTAANVIGNANVAADTSNAQAIEMALKTYQAESDTFSTNNSPLVTKVKALATADQTVKNLIGIYGVSIDLDTLRQSNYNYYYDATSGKVTAGASGTAGTKLASTTKFGYNATSGAFEIKN